MAGVGQINPTPDISVIFKTLATTVIQRSALGILCMILKDTKQTEKWVNVGTIADIDETKWDTKSINLIKLAMYTHSPKKILIRVQGAEEQISTILTETKQRKINWLVAPNATEEEDTTITLWVKQVLELKQ